MGKNAKRKRKLEAAEKDTPPKRVKKSHSQEDSTKRSKGDRSPQVQVSKSNILDPATMPTKISHTEQNGETEVAVGIAPLEEKSSPKSSKTSKERSKRGSLQPNGTTEPKSTVVGPIPGDEDVSMRETQAPQHDASASAEEMQRQQGELPLVRTEINDTEAGSSTLVAADGSGNAHRTKNHRQRALEKRARRHAAREVNAGLRQDIELTTPNHNGWWLSEPSAGRYLQQDPIFVTDENGDECLIAATIREVQLLHLESSLLERTHILPDGRSVFSYSLSARYPDHVDIAYDNGAKVQWNWTTGATMRSTFPGRETIVAMTTAIMEDGRPESFYIAHTQGNYEIVGVRKSMYSTYRPLRSIQVLGKAAFLVCFGITVLVLGRRKDSGDYTWIEMPLTTPPQCVDARVVYPISSGGKKTAHRPGLVLAVGNADGKIHMYSDLSPLFSTSGEARLPTPRILHWHRDAVSALKFSKDGNYLISGGKESVLVIWQLETGNRQFLPHLTAEIERIVVSPEGTQYALQMGDNSIMVLSTAELKPVANFAGLQLPVPTNVLHEEGVEFPSTMAILHPNDPNQLLMTVPSTQPKTAKDSTIRCFLQTFDVQNSRHVSRQALTRNNVTDFNLGPENTPIAPPDVSLLAVSADGHFMATVDEWIPPASDLEHAVSKTTRLTSEDVLEVVEEQKQRREVYLKFWKWDAGQAIWTLSTRADAPHHRFANPDLGKGAGHILELKSDPSSNGFATVGEDGAVKIWRCRTRTRQGLPLKEQDGSVAVEWVCKRTISLLVSADTEEERADSAFEMESDVVVPIGDEDVNMQRQVLLPSTESGKALSVVQAALAFSPDGSMLACSQSTADDNLLPLVHFVNPHDGVIFDTKSGLIPTDQEVLDFGFLDRYIITLSSGSVRVWNLVDDSHHYTIRLPGSVEDQQGALLAVNQVDETFAVAYSALDPEIDEFMPQLDVYTTKRPTRLFEAELDVMPIVLLAAGKEQRGYTIVFEDGTIRSLANTTTTVRSMSTTIVDESDAMEMTVPEEEAPALMLAAAKDDVEMANGMAPLAIEANEDDRPVVRPEQLASIFDLGPGSTLPPVRDMFAGVVGLCARKPRARGAVDGFET